MIDYSVFRILVPKNNEVGPIAAEQLFASLYSLCKQKVNFEIANENGRICFYAIFPSKVKGVVSSQLFGCYPDLEISECEDYLTNCGESFLYNDLRLRNVDFYPIKRYSQFEDKLRRVSYDSLSGITSALVEAGRNFPLVSIQFSVKPLPERWRNTYLRCLRVLNRNRLSEFNFFKNLYSRFFVSRSLVLRILFFPVYFILRLHSFFALIGDSSFKYREFKEMTSTIHEKEATLDAAIDKVSKSLFQVNIRFVYSSPDYGYSYESVNELFSSFSQFNLPNLNGFKISRKKRGVAAVKNRIFGTGFVLNNEELATLFHIPDFSTKVPGLCKVESRKLESPLDLPSLSLDSSPLGVSNFRFDRKKIGILTDDRRRHLYILGKTGMGKSTLLENLIYNDLNLGKGVCIIDPHGDLADKVLSFIPKNRINDVILIDPSDTLHSVALNLFQDVDGNFRSVVCSGIISVFKKLYSNSWGPRLEHILRFSILALLEFEGATLLGIPMILQNEKYRKKVLASVTDQVVLNFWQYEFANLQDKLRVEAISPILNKVGQFISSPIIRNMVGQSVSTVDLGFAMNSGKIVIVNLSKGKIGEDNCTLLGSLLVTKFQLEAMKRVTVPEYLRKDFYLYVDEFQNFATDSFATILSEARKYRLNLILANQYLSQMPESVRDAVFGNVGSILSFQIGFDDAEYISKQFGEVVTPDDLVFLQKYHAYMKLLINGMPSTTFSLTTNAPISVLDSGVTEKVVKVSRERYSRDISLINLRLNRWNASYSM